MFFLNHWDLLSGGALGSLIVGLVASNAWEHGFPRCASIGTCFAFSPESERGGGAAWRADAALLLSFRGLLSGHLTRPFPLPRCAVERILNIVWVWMMEPMLFVTIGASMNFSELATGTIPKSLLIICTGVMLRMICTFFVMSGFGYTIREKVFYSIAWTPKATVQAALSGGRLPAAGSTDPGQRCRRASLAVT